MNPIEKKLNRRNVRQAKELEKLQGFEIDLESTYAPKKPIDFRTNGKIESFQNTLDLGNKVIEKKSDGFCTLLSVDHNRRNKVRIYSSGLNEWNIECFPEVWGDAVRLPNGFYHGELLGKKNKGGFTSLDEYIAVDNRPKTNHNNVTPELLKKFPLKLDVFDALSIDDKTIVSLPQCERRRMLEEFVCPSPNLGLIKQWNPRNAKGLQDLFLKITEDYEGLIAKDPNSLYVPGTKTDDWVKLKGFTTFDLAVLGVYKTEESEKAGKLYSGLLVGTYNERTGKFESMTKVKVPGKEQSTIYEMFKEVIPTEGDVSKVENIAFNPNIYKVEDRKIPGALVTHNEQVPILEVQCLDVTYTKNWSACGLDYDGVKAHSLRIPTYQQLRKDKVRLEDVTTTKMIHDYFLS